MLGMFHSTKKKANGKYWYDICEKETNAKNWFYTCALGDTRWLMPGNTLKYFGIPFEVVLNRGISRPLCSQYKSHCNTLITLKVSGTSCTYFCSVR
ncbi:hypothetical protein YC2023_104921 [Brassica napus]